MLTIRGHPELMGVPEQLAALVRQRLDADPSTLFVDITGAARVGSDWVDQGLALVAKNVPDILSRVAVVGPNAECAEVIRAMEAAILPRADVGGAFL